MIAAGAILAISLFLPHIFGPGWEGVDSPRRRLDWGTTVLKEGSPRPLKPGDLKCDPERP